jgi:hypothetical protein
MTEPIAVVAVDKRGVVLRARVLLPRRVFTVSRATWIVETPPGPLPLAGERADAGRLPARVTGNG